MAGTIIDMSKIKQLLHLKKASVSNRQIAKDHKMSRKIIDIAFYLEGEASVG